MQFQGSTSELSKIYFTKVYFSVQITVTYKRKKDKISKKGRVFGQKTLQRRIVKRGEIYQAQQEKQLFPVDTGSVYNTKCYLT